MFTVYDNNKQCKFPDHKVDSSWDNATFPTLEAAVNYAILWLSEHSAMIPTFWKGDSIDYSGYGDVIEIREGK